MSDSSTTASATSSDGKLLRVLGAGFGIAVALGSSIGAGIMRTPSAIASRLPIVWLIMLAWIVGGVYSLLGAWTLSEVGAMVPSAGAYYAIARRAYGDYISFVVGWTDGISVCGSTAFISLLAGEYLGNLIPSLAGCGKTRFEASAVPQNSLVSTTQPDKKKVCVEKTSSSWMCSAT